MSFTYLPPTKPGPLHQGEVLADVYLPIADHPLTKPAEGAAIPVPSVYHPFLLVLNNNCDLRFDFFERFPDSSSQQNYRQATNIEKTNVLLPFVTTCMLYEESDIRMAEGRKLRSDLWKRVSQNQDERYHTLASAEIESLDIYLPKFFLDFKKTIALPTEYLYQGFGDGGVSRVAILPPPYIHDLVHRYFGFQSRVAVPDD